MKIVGRLAGVLQRFLWLLLFLIEADHLVREQAEEEGILQGLGLLLCFDVLPQCKLGLTQSLIEIPAHGAGPGPGQRLFGVIRPFAGLGQLLFGEIELPLLYAGVDAQQAAVDLQLALLEVGIGQQFVEFVEQGGRGAMGMLLQVAASNQQIEPMGLQLELLLFLGHGDALLKGLLCLGELP